MAAYFLVNDTRHFSGGTTPLPGTSPAGQSHLPIVRAFVRCAQHEPYRIFIAVNRRSQATILKSWVSRAVPRGSL